MFLSGISSITLLTWSGIGLIISLLMHALSSGNVKGGAAMNAIFGIIGAITGGLLVRSFYNITVAVPTGESMLAAALGAIVLSLIYRLLFRERSNIKTTTTRV